MNRRKRVDVVQTSPSLSMLGQKRGRKGREQQQRLMRKGEEREAGGRSPARASQSRKGRKRKVALSFMTVKEGKKSPSSPCPREKERSNHYKERKDTLYSFKS